MKSQQGRVVLLGAVVWLCLSSTVQAGWITLTSGSAGSSQPTATSEFWFGTAATPRVAIDSLSGTGVIQATTGGGSAYFSGLGTPALLNLSDGTATVAGGSLPAGATARGPDGSLIGAPASAAPQVGGSVPLDFVRLGLILTAPNAGGAWVLTASVLDTDGTELSTGSLIVPEGGWWVLGLGADSKPKPGPKPDPEPQPEPEPEPGPGPVPGVPEPGTAALAASGACLVLPWLRRWRRVRPTSA